MSIDDDIDALYELVPEDFVAARDALARSVKNPERARVKALRRPTAAAWVVNQLARREHDQVRELLDIGVQLRTAQQRGRGDHLRALAGQRRALTDLLLKSARRIAIDAGRPFSADVQAAVTASLDAAIADADSGEALLAAQLAEPLQYSGFGAPAMSSVPDAVETGAGKPAGSSSKRRVAARTSRSAGDNPPNAASDADSLSDDRRGDSGGDDLRGDSGAPPRSILGRRKRGANQEDSATAAQQAAQLRAEERYQARAALDAALERLESAQQRVRLAELALSDARMELDLVTRDVDSARRDVAALDAD